MFRHYNLQHSILLNYFESADRATDFSVFLSDIIVFLRSPPLSSIISLKTLLTPPCPLGHIAKLVPGLCCVPLKKLVF
jgi:hypothetical protein